MNIYEYNSSSINYFETFDLGSIGSAATVVEDNGLISSIVATEYIVNDDFIVDSDFIIGDGQIISYGEIVFTQTEYPFGNLKVNINASSARSVIFIAATEPIKLSSITTVVKRSVWVGTGTLFEIGGGQQLTAFSWLASSGPLRVSGSAESKAIYSYNQSSKEVFNTDVYGSVSNAFTVTQNYGTVSDLTGGDSVDYGYIWSTDVLYPFGNINISGNVSQSFQKANYSTSGSFSTLKGSSESKVFVKFESIALFKASGQSVNLSTKAYKGTGSLSNIGSKVEKATYNYNQSAIETYAEVDYGLITASGTTVNYGSIIDQSNEEFNYGYVFTNVTTYPFGTLNISGSCVDEFKPIFGQVGKGSLFAIGGSANIRLFANLESIALFNVTGGEKYKFSGNYIGSGNLLGFNNADPSITYNYTKSSVEDFARVNYGLITASGTTVNYGSVSVIADNEVNYGYVWNIDYAYPFGTVNVTGAGSVSRTRPFIGSGSLFAFNSATYANVNTKQESTALFSISGISTTLFARSYVGSGTEFVYNSLVENRTRSFVGSGSLFNINSSTISETSNPPEETVLFRFSGSAIQKNTESYVGFVSAEVSGSAVERNTESYIGSGSLINIGSKEEKTTYTYNQSSIEIYNDAIDYGTITTSGTTVNYGSVVIQSSEQFNYGYIFTSATTYPFGTLNVSGSSIVDYKPAFVQTGSGSIKIYGQVSDKFILGPYTVKTDTTIAVSGSAKVISQSNYKGGGILFTIGSREEKVTFNYNTSSIEPYAAVDYGYITISGSTISYGNVSSIAQSEFDNGLIVNLNYAYPFGTLNVNGAVKYGVETGYIPVITGRGSLFAIGGKGDAYSRISVSETQLFTVSGSVSQSKSKSFIGSGSLFTINGLTESKAVNPPATGLFKFTGSAAEKNTESYVGSGSISLQTAIYPEYIYYRPTPRYVTGSGDVYLTGQSDTVYFAVYTKIGSGTKFISGSASEKNAESYIGSGSAFISGIAAVPAIVPYIGSGSLFAINGSSVLSTANPPEETALFRFSGSSTEKNTESYVGFVSAEVSGSAIQKSTESYIGSGTEFVYNAALQNRTRSFIGSGSLFTVGSLTIAATNGPTEESATLVISGQASTKFVSVYTYIGSGSEFVFGTSLERETNTFIGSGSLFEFNGSVETFAINPLEEIFTLKISGTAEKSFNRSIVGAGTEFVSGLAAQSHTNTFIGSGSLFKFRGVSESVVYSTKSETLLFSISGSVSVDAIKSYTGSGSAFISGIAAIPATFTYTTKGSAFITGVPKFASLSSYIGSGTLSTLNGSAESITDVPTSTGIFTISGSSYNLFIRSTYRGDGSLFAIGGSSESSIVNALEETPTLVISGSAIATTSVAHTGSGTEYISGSISQKIVSKFDGSGSLFTFVGGAESITSNPPEDSVTIRISGAATEIKISSIETEFGSFSYQGNLTERKTNSFSGTGSLFAIISSAAVSSINVGAETSLFKIGGTGDSSYTRISVFEGGQINITGESINYALLPSPSRIFGTII